MEKAIKSGKTQVIKVLMKKTTTQEYYVDTKFHTGAKNDEIQKLELTETENK